MSNDQAIQRAAEWLAPQSGLRHVIAELRTRYGLNAREAVEAIKLANQLRSGRRAAS